MRPDADGVWRPDWAEVEPDPITVPTIAWLTWHIDCPPQAGGAPRWSTAVDHLTAAPPRQRTEVTWPGTDAVVARLRRLAAQWRDALTTADLAVPSAFPWGEGSERTIAHTALWANVELTKDISEIGQLRLLRRAGRQVE